MDTKKKTCQFAGRLPNGNYFEGTLVNGVIEGKGHMKFTNYDIYKGNWVSGKMEGEGTFLFYDSKCDRHVASYMGQFKNSKFNGTGKMNYSDGTVYYGQWKNGLREGEGQLYFHSGRIISGLWHNDILPQGTCIEANGNRYVGQLSNECQYSGYGTLFLSNGSWAQGVWEDNVLVSGKLFTDDGFILDYLDKKVINKLLWKRK